MLLLEAVKRRTGSQPSPVPANRLERSRKWERPCRQSVEADSCSSRSLGSKPHFRILASSRHSHSTPLPARMDPSDVFL